MADYTLLHTSDWHLGQHFYGKTREAEHRAIIDWLVEQVAAHQVDAVVIAGDVFDTATPPSYARECYLSMVARLSACGCQLVVLGGNHDSVAVLNESRSVATALKAHVIADLHDDLESHVIELKSRDGETGAVLCALPFIRSRSISVSEEGETGREKGLQLMEGISKVYHAVYDIATQRANQAGDSLSIIGTGHLTTFGASRSESERDIYIGGLDTFPAEDFPAFDYLALGHIHRPQRVAGKEHWCYSGSPLPLSFDEASNEKSVSLVRIEGGSLSVEKLIVPRTQQLVQLKGDLDSVFEQISELAPEQPIWLDIEVESDGHLHDLQQRLTEQLEDTRAELLLLRRRRVAGVQVLSGGVADESLHELSVIDVFRRRLDTLDDTDDERLTERKKRATELFQQVVGSLEHGYENS
tara:strand:- start:223 stop:1461 length:1239 start_codon:yes stop_codon:yes gene_type:complete